jgi:hypothetical protein
VIGVGDYPFLKGGSALKKARNSFGLGQVKPPIQTSMAIVDWLLQSYKNDECPLGSVEFLLSPEGILDTALGPQQITPATMSEIKAAVKRWYDRCNENPANTAFFYFCGHGLSKTVQYLLPQDFGDPDLLQDWENCVDFTNFRVGMRRCAAQTQVFFIDACRDTPIDVLREVTISGDPLVNSSFSDRVATSAAYFAAVEGAQSFGPAGGGVTLFGQAVLHCLNGAGSSNENGTWAVDTYKLGDSIGRVMKHLFEHTGMPLGCSPHPEGTNAILHYPEKPYVLVSIGCEPAAAEGSATITLERADARATSSNQGFSGQLHPGEWSVAVEFPASPTYQAHKSTVSLVPPTYNRRVPIQ